MAMMATMSILGTVILSLFPGWSQSLCPLKCKCTQDKFGRHLMECKEGGLTDITSVLRMDYTKNEEIIKISAPHYRLNYLEIGPIFQVYKQLRELHITHSNIPSIGMQVFLGMKQLKVLNLSFNNITQLRLQSFKGLAGLEALWLASNNIESVPSASFQHLTSLKLLDLSSNRLHELSSRMFAGLSHLESIDLSHNPLRRLDPEILEDLGKLKRLRCQNCSLHSFNQTTIIYEKKRIKTITLFHVAPLLEELDFRDNDVRSLEPEQFFGLKHLRILRLDGNRLMSIPGRTFVTHNLLLLSLSNNYIDDISPYAFYDVVIRELDLSHNRFPYVEPEIFRDIAPNLKGLKLSGNPVPLEVLQDILKQARKLMELSLDDVRIINIDPRLGDYMQNIRLLNLSSNYLKYLPNEFLDKLRSLRVLDISHNKFRGLNDDTLDRFNNYSIVYMHNNEWVCDLCHIPPMIRWYRMNLRYLNSCNDTRNVSCLTCLAPYHLAGRQIRSLYMNELGTCIDESAELLTQSNVSQVGIVVGCFVTLLLCAILVLLLLLYNKQTAYYYTHEERQDGVDGLCEDGSYVEDKKSEKDTRSSVATIDNISTEDNSPQADTKDLIVKLEYSPKLNGRLQKNVKPS